MARRTIFQSCLTALTALCVASLASAQSIPQSSLGALRADPKTASISGHVALPSGSSANFNIRVTLSNTQSPLTTFYTDKHGEFDFLNLTEGTYYIEVSGDRDLYEPVTEKVRLSRGQVTHLTIYLKRKDEVVNKASGSSIVSATEFNQEIPPAAKSEYEKAMKLANRGKLQEAVERLKQAIAICSDYQMARNDLGVQYLKLKRLDEAAEQFQAVIERSPKYFNSRLNLGLVLIEQNKYGEAVNQLNQAISIDSARPAAHLWLGVALLETNQIAEAERELLRALLLGGSGYSVAHYYIAHINLMKGLRDDAMRELEIYLQEAATGEQATAARLLLEKLKARK